MVHDRILPSQSDRIVPGVTERDPLQGETRELSHGKDMCDNDGRHGDTDCYLAILLRTPT